jgi:hypothetical protein
MILLQRVYCVEKLIKNKNIYFCENRKRNIILTEKSNYFDENNESSGIPKYLDLREKLSIKSPHGPYKGVHLET